MVIACFINFSKTILLSNTSADMGPEVFSYGSAVSASKSQWQQTSQLLQQMQKKNLRRSRSALWLWIKMFSPNGWVNTKSRSYDVPKFWSYNRSDCLKMLKWKLVRRWSQLRLFCRLGQVKKPPTNDWLVVWNINFIFPYIGLLIIPIDFHIFQRGGPTTNQMMIFLWEMVRLQTHWFRTQRLEIQSQGLWSRLAHCMANFYVAQTMAMFATDDDGNGEHIPPRNGVVTGGWLMIFQVIFHSFEDDPRFAPLTRSMVVHNTVLSALAEADPWHRRQATKKLRSNSWNSQERMDVWESLIESIHSFSSIFGIMMVLPNIGSQKHRSTTKPWDAMDSCPHGERTTQVPVTSEVRWQEALAVFLEAEADVTGIADGWLWQSPDIVMV